MHQVIFHFPIIDKPLFAFGAMLLLAFFLVLYWGKWRIPAVGLPWERFQDMSMLLLATGIAGARVVYMWQYYDQFEDKSPLGLLIAFVKIWDGGIVFYGSIFGGLLGYLFFRHFVVKRLGVNGWQLADGVAPMLALGMAIGRIGCYLNGCCWGQVAVPDVQPMPLPATAGQFPLVPSHARKQLTWPADENARLPQLHGLQTTTGFSLKPRSDTPLADTRSVVAAVEPGTAAERAGLQAGDKVVELNGKPNYYLLEVLTKAENLDRVVEATTLDGVTLTQQPRPEDYVAVLCETTKSTDLPVLKGRLAPLGTKVVTATHDSLYEHVRAGPLAQTELALVVERNGQRVPVTFTPRTVTFFPTQLYETISMILLMLLLLAFQPFRRHDGQVMVMLMLCYAVHRFLNEAIRIEPTYRFGLTLSQWISVGIFVAGLGLELYLRLSQPKLPPGAIPLGYGAKPIPQPLDTKPPYNSTVPNPSA